MTSSVHYGGDIKSKHEADRAKVYLGSWSSNFNSWKSFESVGKYLLIKYEELISNREETLLKILKYIHKLKKINFVPDNKKLKNVLESTTFEKMKSEEEKEGFSESRTNLKTNEKIPFFNLGPKNKWQNILKPKIIKKIENSFSVEMKELGYL